MLMNLVMFSILTCRSLMGNVFILSTDLLCLVDFGNQRAEMVHRILIGLVIAYIAGSAAWIIRSGFISTSHSDLLNVSYDPTRVSFARH